MSLAVFLRGVNVGGHRTFRPKALAERLADFDVVNVGAAGTFVVRKPGSAVKLETAILQALPFEADIVLREGRDVIRLEDENPFGKERVHSDRVQFVSLPCGNGRIRPTLPITLPAEGKWLLRIVDVKRRFIFGEYRRHMKTIGYLGQLDKLLGVPVTTRNWNTMLAVARILKSEGE